MQRRRFHCSSELDGRHVILFLDFDGVLHPRPVAARNCEVFCAIHRLEDVLRQVPDVEVVISSSWRHHHPFGEMREYFAEDVRCRVGVTPTCTISRTGWPRTWANLTRSSSTVSGSRQADLRQSPSFPRDCSRCWTNGPIRKHQGYLGFAEAKK
jgi:hypothetical protein